MSTKPTESSCPPLEGLTPMMRQYYGLKSQCQEAILFFRMGDFYEIFGSDAEVVAPLLDIVLTSRDKAPFGKGSGDKSSQEPVQANDQGTANGNKIPFCGVPHHSARNYWLKLLKRGMKVAIADQVEDPATAKGLVKRDIIRVYTPGLIDDLEGLDSGTPNYLMAILQLPGVVDLWTILVVDVSTGELRLGNIKEFKEVLEFIKVTQPKELLVRKFFVPEITAQLKKLYGDIAPVVGDLPEAILRDEQSQKQMIAEVFGSNALSNGPQDQGVEGGSAIVAAVLVHLKGLKVPLTSLMRIGPLSDPETMVLDDIAIRDLELFETTRRRQTEGSFFRTINQTLTPMGTRLFRRNLIRPLLSQTLIESRQNIVEQLVQFGESNLSEFRQALKGCPDLERLSVRVANGLASPMDLGRLSQALQHCKQLFSVLNRLLSTEDCQNQGPIKKMLVELNSGFEVSDLLKGALEDQLGPLGSGKGVFKTGYDVDLDKKRHFVFAGEEVIFQYQERLKEQTGISSLKIKFQKNYGHLIEITKTHSTKVPTSFIKRQTMVNAERYTTPELQELSENIENAQVHFTDRERQLFTMLNQKVAAQLEAIQRSSETLAYFDMLHSFAWQALKFQYSRPRIVKNGGLVLRGSRHPVVETFIGQHDFFANDINIVGDYRQLLITGPNMAGKSTLMRQVALTALMAQVGCFVPAKSAELPIFDRIFTRVGASDDLVKGQSTFMVEMSEAAHILKCATKRSLVILDEVGRGTSTQDGLALAAAILADLSQRIGCMALFATHYRELVDFGHSLPSVQAVQTEVIERGDEIVFTHRLKPGATSSSYGIEVARIAGIPPMVLEQAKKIASESHEDREKSTSKLSPKIKTNQLPLPLEDRGELELIPYKVTPIENEWIDRIKRLNLYRMTPLQALNLLAELQTSLEVVSKRSEPLL